MNSEFIINGALAIIGVGLLAAGIISLIRHKSTRQTIFGGIATATGIVMLMIVLLTTSLSSVSGSYVPGQASAPIIDNGAIITGKVIAIESLESRYPWQIAIQIEKVENLGELPNPVADQEGQLLVLRTDQNIGKLNVGQEITGTVKLSGDVEDKTFLYLSGIK